MAGCKGLTERLKNGETIVVAEGYLFEFEARGYLKSGGFVPEVVLDHPELVKTLHEEFVHAGSDVVIAFTYYGHREKLRLIGREDDLEKLNKEALKIARLVADETTTLMAGNISNSNILTIGDPASEKTVKSMFKEQIEWARDGGADFIIAETFQTYAEAAMALQTCKEVAPGLPVVVTLVVHKDGLFDGVDVAEACRRLEEQGAAVVGLNCSRGPATMLPLLKQIRKKCQGPIAGIPVTYRTTEEYPTFNSFPSIDGSDEPGFPLQLDAWLCSRSQIRQYAIDAKEAGVQYMGLCCGNRSNFTREMAEAMGRKPPTSRYAPDVSLHYSRLGGSASEAYHENYKS